MGRRQVAASQVSKPVQLLDNFFESEILTEPVCSAPKVLRQARPDLAKNGIRNLPIERLGDTTGDTGQRVAIATE